MRFKQRSTGTVLETDNEAVIEMMTASDAYVVEQPEQEQPTKKTTRGTKK